MKIKLILILIIIIIFFISCKNSRHIPVYIEVQNKNTIDFEKYDKILYMDLKTESLPKNVNTEKEIKNFFLKEFPQIINKDIQQISQADMPEENENNKTNLKNVIKYFPNSLLITGKLNCSIKNRSRVKEVKDESGEKIKKFVKIQEWRVRLDVWMLDSNSGETIFKDEFSDHMKEANPEKTSFNFKSTFNNVTDRFIRKIQKRSRMTRRYLLTN